MNKAAKASAAPRQAFLPIATIIFAGRRPVKRFIPFSQTLQPAL
jgi:hypothetical protein